jgi:WD40 repeat protein
MKGWTDPEACGATEPSDHQGGVPSRVRVVTRGLAVILATMTVGLVYLADEPRSHLALCASSEGFRGTVRGQTFAPQGRRIYACTSDGSLLSWIPGLPVTRVDLGDDLVLNRRTAFAPNVLTLAVSSHDGGVTLWDLATIRRRFRIPPRAGRVSALAFSRDSATLALADGAGVQLLDAARGLPLEGPRLKLCDASCVAFAPDGRTLAVGGVDGIIRVWNPADKEPRTAFRAHGTPVTSLEFADDGEMLASASHDDHVARLWQVDRGRLLAELEACSQVQAITFAPGNRELAIAGLDGVVRVWETATPGPCRVIQEHDGPVTALAFSPAGERLVCGGIGSIWLYRVDMMSTPTNR